MGIKGFDGRLLKWLMSLILTQNGIFSHSVTASIAFYLNVGVSLDETDWEFINGGTRSLCVLKSHNVLLCFFVLFFSQTCWQCPSIRTLPWKTGGWASSWSRRSCWMQRCRPRPIRWSSPWWSSTRSATRYGNCCQLPVSGQKFQIFWSCRFLVVFLV